MEKQAKKIENSPITKVAIVKNDVVGYNGRKKVEVIVTPDMDDGNRDRIEDLRSEMVEEIEEAIEEDKLFREDFLVIGDGYWENEGGEEEIEESEDEGGEHEGMHIGKKYRDRYTVQNSDGWMSCADKLAVALTEFCTVKGKSKRKGKMVDADVCSVAKVKHVSGQNHLGTHYTEHWSGLNAGHQRMCLSNTLRGMLKRGEEVKVGDKVLKPEAEDKAKAKAKIKEAEDKVKAREAAKAEREKAKAIDAKDKAKEKVAKNKAKKAKEKVAKNKAKKAKAKSKNS